MFPTWKWVRWKMNPRKKSHQIAFTWKNVLSVFLSVQLPKRGYVSDKWETQGKGKNHQDDRPAYKCANVGESVFTVGILLLWWFQSLTQRGTQKARWQLRAVTRLPLSTSTVMVARNSGFVPLVIDLRRSHWSVVLVVPECALRGTWTTAEIRHTTHKDGTKSVPNTLYLIQTGKVSIPCRGTRMTVKSQAESDPFRNVSNPNRNDVES